MASGWPDQIWAPWQENADPMTGMADFNKPEDPRTKYGIKKGLPDDWRKTYKKTVGKSNAWDVIGTDEVAGNALFAAAADAIGLDWDEWRAETMKALGTEEDFEAAMKYIDKHRPDSDARAQPYSRGTGGILWFNQRDWKSGDDWDDLTDAQQEIVENQPRPTRQQFSADDDLPPGFQRGPGGQITPIDPDAPGGVLNPIGKDKDKDDDEEPFDWGIGTGFNQISKDLTEMQEWLEGVNKKAKENQADIIADGPKKGDYNLEGKGTIFDILGLTKAPGAPKELAVTFEGDYTTLRHSRATYKKPSDRYMDIQISEPRDYDSREPSDPAPVYEDKSDKSDKSDESGESVPSDVTEDRPYADYEGDGDKSDRHPDRQAQVDDAFKSKRRWRHNVREIIGKDQDWEGWAKAAGISNLNSRNDSDRIKEFYRANKDKMSFPIDGGKIVGDVKLDNGRWTDNVQTIIGKDQDVASWASAAGVSNLNSRNDSNKIKKFFRKNKGVLPTK